MCGTKYLRAILVVLGSCAIPTGYFAAGVDVRAATLSSGDVIVGATTMTNGVFEAEVMKIDPATGNRTLISGNGVGSGPSMSDVGTRSVSEQPDGSLLVVTEDAAATPSESRLYRVDPATGDRTLIADAFNVTYSAARDFGNTILVSSFQAGFATVDPVTGVSSPFSITGGAGPVIPAAGFILDGTNIIATNVGASNPGLYTIDSLTGTSTLLSSGFTPVDVARDLSGNLVATDLGAIYHVDATTGIQTVISNNSGVGTGPQLDASNIAVDSTGKILVTNLTGSVYTIDPVTGNRTVFSGGGVGTGPSLGGGPLLPSAGLLIYSNVPEPSTLILAAFGGLALLAWRKSRLHALTFLSVFTVATAGLAAGGVARAATLSPGTIVVGEGYNPHVIQNFDARLIAVDPVTGTPTVISDNAIGTGPSLSFGDIGSYIDYISQQSDGSLLVVDDSTTVAGMVSTSGESRLYRVDPSTGNRTLILDTPSTAPEITAARQVENTIFITTSVGLETVDPSTGIASPFATTGVSVTAPLYGFMNVGVQIYAASPGVIYKIDSSTGASSILSSLTVGTGPVTPLFDLAIDPTGKLYSNSLDGIYGINQTTGDRTLISGTPPGSAPSVGIGTALVALNIGTSATGEIFAINATGALLSIDPTTGNRTILSQIETTTPVAVVCAGLAVISNVPEPSTLILAAFGGLALLTRIRRKPFIASPDVRRGRTS